MDVATMHQKVNLRVQKIDSNAYDNILSQEIDSYLNKAVVEFIKDRWNPESNPYREGFEQSQKRIDDLRTLVKKNQEQDTQQVVSNASIENFYVDRATFPSDYFIGISARFKVDYNEDGVNFTLTSGKRQVQGTEDKDFSTKIVAGKIVQQDDVYQLLVDPFNTTRIQRPIFDVGEDGIDVYTDDNFIVDKVILNYIREPAVISLSGSVNCDLPEQTHEEIVDKTARMILGDIDRFGPQGQLQELSDTE